MPNVLTTSPVTEVKAADSSLTIAHFERLLTFETDCWAVHAAQATGEPGFVLLGVRSAQRLRAGYVAAAINLPRGRLTVRTRAPSPPDTLCVGYCAVPHCNG